MLRRFRLKQLLDAVVTLAMGVAAAIMIWRGVGPPSGVQATTPPPKLAIEDVSSSQLTTTLEGTMSRGSADARIVLIEFADFECPFCRKYHQETFSKVEEELVASGKVRYVFRHFPLEQVHFNAVAAARAAECASEQDKFWEMRAQLFERQPEIGRAFWVPASREMGLQTARFEKCLQTASRDDRIRRDQEEANRLGVKVTPTFLLGVSEGKVVRVFRKIEGARNLNVFTEAVEALASMRTK